MYAHFLIRQPYRYTQREIPSLCNQAGYPTRGFYICIYIYIYILYIYWAHAPQSLRAHGAFHGCAGGAGDAIKSYFEATNLIVFVFLFCATISYFRSKFIISIK